MKTLPKFLALAVAALMLNGCDNVGSWFGNDKSANNDKEGFVERIEHTKSDGTVQMLLPDFTQLVDQEGATVVNIQATKTIQKNRRRDAGDLSQFPENDPFYEFFKRLVPNMPDMPQDEGSELNFGSGFIISADGYILTNTHVLSGMNTIRVTLNDKREYTAKLIGSDQQSDVALLKIEAENLPVVKIGDVKAVKPGEWVAAIGAPFGFDNSVTAGIVSAKGRSLPNENYTPFIQTDVAINPGNSGGPLFNLKGEVIGINSQIYSRSGGFMGISFAIPIDVAMNVANQLKTNGKVQRGQLGVIIQEVSYDLAKSFGLEQATGALVAKVLPGSPAARAGLQVGDIVRSVDGEPVRASNDLPVIVGGTQPGKEVTLNVWRRDKEVEIKVKLGSADGEVASADNQSVYPAHTDEGQSFTIESIGLTLRSATTEDDQHLEVVESTAAAAQAGLRRGDEILAVGQLSVSDEASFRSALEQAGKNIPLLVQRGNTTLFLALNLQ